MAATSGVDYRNESTIPVIDEIFGFHTENFLLECIAKIKPDSKK